MLCLFLKSKPTIESIVRVKRHDQHDLEKCGNNFRSCVYTERGKKINILGKGFAVDVGSYGTVCARCTSRYYVSLVRTPHFSVVGTARREYECTRDQIFFF